ncbi:hypothetical protein EVAR_4521_1 [Eumeta japonica]|uniref:Uncharacterized protein n=1 Tax=Eumeta variegata TaxID=151549 RepID=A0A4C1SW12_EUMVA|nr:hypothetical protein EVAR_4521_1 [Eumeta japonica]
MITDRVPFHVTIFRHTSTVVTSCGVATRRCYRRDENGSHDSLTRAPAPRTDALRIDQLFSFKLSGFAHIERISGRRVRDDDSDRRLNYYNDIGPVVQYNERFVAGQSRRRLGDCLRQFFVVECNSITDPGRSRNIPRPKPTSYSTVRAERTDRRAGRTCPARVSLRSLARVVKFELSELSRLGESDSYDLKTT